MKTMRYLSWLAIAAMIIAGCGTRIDPYRPHGGGGNNGGGDNGGGGQQPQLTLTERTDWSVLYRGRTFVDADGCMEEEFQFNYTGNNYFILRTVTDADLEKFYDGSVRTLIDEEVAWTLQSAKKQDVSFKDLNEVFNKTIKTFYSGILVHDTYTAYLIEIDGNGKATYNYAKAQMVVQEEAASAEYISWLGTWMVSNGYVGYDITVSPIENNYFYRVDGWEAGQGAGSVQMNQDDDWIETRLMDDGTMSFFIQFIASYENYENLGDVDFMFVGTYLSTDGENVDDWEGWEVAYAEHTSGGYALLNGGKSEIELNNGTIWRPYYYAMRYAVYSNKNSLWYFFHDSVPVFDEEDHQIAMAKTKGTVDADITTVHTRNYVRRTQPRAVVSGAREAGEKSLAKLRK
ncbi:MAG: hypothetical protein IK008_05415 [Bacteroidales bacterium]|nr:hypothetical protein [Bacteroidales bacterium]